MGTRGPQNAATAVAAAASATAAALEPWPKGRTAAAQPSTPESLGATATALMSLSWAATAAVTRSLAGSSASGDTSERSQTCCRVGGGRGCTVCVRLAWGDETQRARRPGPLPAGQHDHPCPAHSCQTRTACMPAPAKQLHAKQLHATLIASGPLAPSKQLHARPGGRRATTCKPHLGAPSGSLLDVPKPTLSSLSAPPDARNLPPRRANATQLTELTWPAPTPAGRDGVHTARWVCGQGAQAAAVRTPARTRPHKRHGTKPRSRTNPSACCPTSQHATNKPPPACSPTSTVE